MEVKERQLDGRLRKLLGLKKELGEEEDEDDIIEAWDFDRIGGGDRGNEEDVFE